MNINQNYFERSPITKETYRTEQNPGHSEDKVWFREMRIKKLLNKIREK